MKFLTFLSNVKPKQICTSLWDRIQVQLTFFIQDYPHFIFDIYQVVTSLADPSANIIFGAVVDDRYNGEIHVTIVATGFSQSFQKTLLTDPKASRLLDKVIQESKGSSTVLSKSSPNSLPPRQPPRKLFF